MASAREETLMVLVIPMKSQRTRERAQLKMMMTGGRISRAPIPQKNKSPML